jgi:prepilin-type processing-associated H-X9-DG protein
MKTLPATNRTKAFTRTELFVVIAVIAVLVVAMLLPALSAAKQKALRITCVNHLAQIGTTFKIWEGDHGDKFPMYFARTNSETMGLIGSGRAYVLWQTLSNELSSAKVLRCPADTKRVAVTNFSAGFSDANISYFFSLDTTTDINPQMILDGDDNLAVNGVRVKPGILNLSTTNSLAWTKERHGVVGNIGMADGSVMQVTSNMLNSIVLAATNGSPVNTYRLVIP